MGFSRATTIFSRGRRYFVRLLRRPPPSLFCPCLRSKTQKQGSEAREVCTQTQFVCGPLGRGLRCEVKITTTSTMVTVLFSSVRRFPFYYVKARLCYTLADTLHRSPSTSRRVLAFLCPSQCREGGGRWLANLPPWSCALLFIAPLIKRLVFSFALLCNQCKDNPYRLISSFFYIPSGLGPTPSIDGVRGGGKGHKKKARVERPRGC